MAAPPLALLPALLSRRGSLRLLAALLTAGGLPLVQEAEAKPVDHVQHRAAKRRQRGDHRREQRREEQRHDGGTDGPKDQDGNDPKALLDGFDLHLNNETGEVGLHVECGFDYDSNCTLNAVFNMGTTHQNQEQFLTDENAIYVWWANRFWIDFRNDAFRPVWIELAQDGSARFPNCFGTGRLVLPHYDMAVGQTAHVELSDRYFVDFRRDRDYVRFGTPDSFKSFQVWFRRHPLP
jgi:hypothetical protein